MVARREAKTRTAALDPPKAKVRGPLLRWFDRHRRDLPWRRTRDPYAIWLSEVMLQQTQVDRVIGYWERFLAEFPTVKKLASADLGQVLKLWSGLGYYSRARNLHRAAQAVATEHRGKLPRTAEALLELPGFGRYTAGAVASIAFGEAAPLVDGNVARVLSRVFEVEGLPGAPEREAALWSIASALVKGERPGDFNQALMELGALVCTPRAPTCLLCPLHAQCRARRTGRVDELPPARKRAARQRLTLAVAVARSKHKLLLARRAEGGLFGGLWELPSAEIERHADGPQALLTLLGEGAWIGRQLFTLQRTLTHRDLELVLFEASVPGPLEGRGAYQSWKWTDPVHAGELGMSSATAALLERVTAG